MIFRLLMQMTDGQKPYKFDYLQLYTVYGDIIIGSPGHLTETIVRHGSDVIVVENDPGICTQHICINSNVILFECINICDIYENAKQLVVLTHNSPWKPHENLTNANSLNMHAALYGKAVFCMFCFFVCCMLVDSRIIYPNFD